MIFFINIKNNRNKKKVKKTRNHSIGKNSKSNKLANLLIKRNIVLVKENELKENEMEKIQNEKKVEKYSKLNDANEKHLSRLNDLKQAYEYFTIKYEENKNRIDKLSNFST